MGKKITIAIDGFSSCGKSTFAKKIAERLGYLYIDSGAMYRAVTLEFLNWEAFRNNTPDTRMTQQILSGLQVGFSFNEQKKTYETTLNGKVVEDAIRNPRISELVSAVSAIPEVREKMVELQRLMGKDKGVVMDGRDIGTVVFPDAELKIFMTADPAIRAERRYKELQSKGVQASLEEVLNNILERDKLDQTRAISPLRKAEDAIELDNSYMTIDEQMEWAEKLIAARIC